MTTEALYLQQIINGLSLGAMYALLALGFTLVYGILELINFAHFNVFMVSSFVGMWALELLGLSGQSVVLSGFALVGALLFAFAVTMLVGGVLGVAVERLALRPMRAVRGTAAMITTIGVSYILFNTILLTVGADSKNYPNPMPAVSWSIDGATLRLREVLIWGVAAALMLGLYYNYTSFIIGYSAGLRPFTAAVLGGIGSVPGAMLGGVLIGLIEALGGQIVSVRWTDVIIFSILVLVLVFVPSGLLGRAAPTKS